MTIGKSEARVISVAGTKQDIKDKLKTGCKHLKAGVRCNLTALGPIMWSTRKGPIQRTSSLLQGLDVFKWRRDNQTKSPGNSGQLGVDVNCENELDVPSRESNTKKDILERSGDWLTNCLHAELWKQKSKC